MSNLSVFNYNGTVIQRRDDGFVSLTQMCRANGKRLDHFMKAKKTKSYIASLSNSLQMEVVQSEEGANGGTWGHPSLAINLARWISDDFAVWCDAHIFNLMASGSTSLDTDPVEMMKLKIELAAIESQKEAAIAQGKNADLQLTQFRHYVTTALPEPVQQKILGYEEVKTTEIVERVIDRSSGEMSDGLGITYVAKSLGLTNKQCWSWLERNGYGKNSEHWEPQLSAVTSLKMSRETFEEVKHRFGDGGDRQMWIGE